MCFDYRTNLKQKIEPLVVYGGTLTVLRAFDFAPNNGLFLDFSLVEDSAGNLFGTSTFGGSGGAGSGAFF